MPPIKVRDTVDLLKGSTLTLPPNGTARLELAVDPESNKLELLHPDQYADAKALPMREGDVTVLGGTTRWDPKRETPVSRSFNLGNTEGVDALFLTAESRHLSGRARYDVVIRDASNQADIQADLIAQLDVTNSGRDFNGALQLLLSQPQPAYPFPYAREAVKSADPVMRSAGGAVLLPIADELVLAGQSDVNLNISAAVNGTPDAGQSEVPLRLKQNLNAVLPLVPGTVVGALSTQKAWPEATFELSGTQAPRPAGDYRILEELGDGLVEAGGGQTHQYTEKGASVNIPGVTYRAIELESNVRTSALTDVGPGPNGGTLVRTRLAGTVAVRSQTPHERTVKLAIPLGNFEKVASVDVRQGTRVLKVSYDADQRTAVVDVPVKGNQTSQLSVAVVGDVVRY